MRIFTKTSAIAVSAIALSVGTAFTVHADDSAAIKYRQAVMRAVGGHTGGAFAIMKGQVPYKDNLLAHAIGLDQMARILPSAFEQKTQGGETRAKADIWEDAAGFQEKIREIQTATADFLAAVESGDQAAAREKLGPVGESCKGCHRKFREKKP